MGVRILDGGDYQAGWRLLIWVENNKAVGGILVG